MKMMKTLILAFAICPFAAQAYGGMTSSGGDNKHMTWESAWFLGEVPISYCIEIAPTEGLTVAQVKADFDSVVATWKRYYFQRTTNMREESHKLNFNFHLEACKPSTQLKLYVGGDNAEIAKAKSNYQAPFSLAYRSDFDSKAGMGKGFIWFAPKYSVFPNKFPDWSLPYTFHGMLLHEMGHVYGCGHVESTIMEENLIAKLQTGESSDSDFKAAGKMYMTNIDHHRFMLLRTDSDFSMKGEIHPDLSGQEPRRIFELLVGRPAQGEISVEAIKTGYQIELIYKDSVGKTSFKLNVNSTFASEFRLGGQVFSTVRDEENDRWDNVGYSYGPTGYAYTTSLTTPKGKSYVASVAINGDEIGRPIHIKFFDGQKMAEAFRADLWLTHGIKK